MGEQQQAMLIREHVGALHSASGFLGASTQVESKQQRASWCLAPCVCWLAVLQRAAAECDV